ncbi:MAG: hypothetical protein H0V25_11170 [Solirubrobacterales bacterium]|nr:hypothetical protein [Solirubrobacterales bacterium]
MASSPLDRRLTPTKVKKIAKKQIKDAAPGLSVAKAKQADNAAQADTASLANNAKAPNVYAHVTEEGDVDEARSRGIADANVTRAGGTGIYCFTGLPDFKTVYAMQSIESLTATTKAVVMVAIRGDAAGICAAAGVAGTQLTMSAVKVDGTEVADNPEPFDIWLST